MIRPALILAAGTFLAPEAACAQLLPGDGSDGVIEVNLIAVPFSTTDIVEVSTYVFENLFHVKVSLLPEFDTRIAELTRGKVGHEIWVTLCGKRIVTAVIQDEITTATFVISTGIQEDARDMVEYLQDPPCASQS